MEKTPSVNQAERPQKKPALQRLSAGLVASRVVKNKCLSRPGCGISSGGPHRSTLPSLVPPFLMAPGSWVRMVISRTPSSGLCPSGGTADTVVVDGMAT